MTLVARRGTMSRMWEGARRATFVLLALGVTASAGAGCRRREPAAPVEPARAVQTADPAVTPGKPVRAGSVLAKGFAFELAVYHLPRPKTDPDEVLARSLRGRPIALRPKPVEGPPAQPVMWVVKPALSDYPPPAGEMLESVGEGLTDVQKRALGGSQSVTVLAFAGPGQSAAASYRHALALASDLAAATGGLVWDQETRQIFSREAWAGRLDSWHEELPEVTKHVVIQVYRDGDLFRMITAGMGKLALPDVVVNQVASSNQNVFGSIINLACQTLSEHPALARDGELTLAFDDLKHPGARGRASENILKDAKRRATVQLAVAEPQEGDPDNALVEIVFPGAADELHVRQIALGDQLYGSKDEIAYVEHDDAILAASRRAKAALMKHKPRFLKKELPVGERLLVKAPFRTPGGGNEWMWVEVVRWKGRTIRGILDNDPYEVTTLKAGSKVEVKEGSLFDYLLFKPDGTQEGNETGRLMQRQQR